MINPLNQFHFWVNFGYTILTCIGAIIVLYSFKKNVDLNIIMYPMIIVTARSELRLLDFEDSMNNPDSNLSKKVD